ncbi:MAG: hypothetical protein ACOCSD_03910 [Halolamina sp.]
MATDTESVTETATRTETETPEPDPEIVEAVMEGLEEQQEQYDLRPGDRPEDVSEEFLLALKDDGSYTENGREFVSRLERIEESLGLEQAVGLSVSVLELDEISEEDLTVIDRWLNSPREFQETALIGGSSTGAFDGLVGGLIDSTDDGIRDGFYIAVLPAGVDLFTEPAPEVAERIEDLRDDGYTERALDYLAEVGRYRQYQEDEYGEWNQAERMGLLSDATENGEITDEELWGIRNDSDNHLINAQAEEFGSDPEESDTSGDGFDDHLLWLLQEAFDYDVHPTEPNVFVEVASVESVDPLTESERETLVDFFREEAPEGPIHLHLWEGANDIEPFDDGNEFRQVAIDNAERNKLGHHLMLLTDRDYDNIDNEDEVAGYNSWETSMANGSDSKGSERLSTVVHELGHSLGINSASFDGVDSEEYSAQEYDSVMNYNQDEITFNEGEPFDDWERIREVTYGHTDLDLADLEAAWEEGSA